jgi:serine/threonine protein kinase
VIGTVLAGHRVESLIGEGGMGVVYRVTHVQLGKTRALKLLPPRLAHDVSFRERFEREWRLAAEIEHENIVEVLDAGETDGRLYIVMRYIEGGNLGTVLAKAGTLEPARASSILRQVASALDNAHARGLIHRDVKPPNILVAAGDRAYLTDFGVAKSTATQGVTKTGLFVGTAAYAAPEQIEGLVELDGRVDVYALGGVLYSCLTGVRPYEKDSDVEVMYAHLKEPPPAPTAKRPELPRPLDRVVARAMAKQRDERYSSCGALVADLEEAIRRPVVGLDIADTVPDMVHAPTRPSPVRPTAPSPRPIATPSADETLPAEPRAPGAAPSRPRRWRATRRRRVALVAAVAAAAAGVVVAAVALRGGGSSQTRAVFSDSFSSPASSFFASRQSTAGRSFIDKGRLLFLVERPRNAVERLADIGTRSLTDVRVSVQARGLSGPTNFGLAVICRYADPTNFYLLAIRSNGDYNIGRSTSGGHRFLRYWTPSPAIRAGTALNTLVAECRGQRNVSLSLSVNGKAVDRVVDKNGIPSGQVGLRAGTGDEAGVTVAFDNFSVRKLD